MAAEMGESSSWQERLWRRKRLHALGFKFEEYDKYLETPYWQSFRRSAFAKQRQRLGRNCRERCPKNGLETKLDVHHLTYERLGNEKIEDVQIVCKECHDKIHLRDQKNWNRHRAPGYER
jgi:5-methylcytosine-specific restriction endonuclease McrA